MGAETVPEWVYWLGVLRGGALGLVVGVVVGAYFADRHWIRQVRDQVGAG